MKDIYENINRDLLIELQAIKVRLNKFNLINLINLDRNFYVFILISKSERKKQIFTIFFRTIVTDTEKRIWSVSEEEAWIYNRCSPGGCKALHRDVIPETEGGG